MMSGSHLAILRASLAAGLLLGLAYAGAGATVPQAGRGPIAADDCAADIDGDGIPNGQDPDVDGDGIPNGQDRDVDGDGLSNADPAETDIDCDGLADGVDRDVDGDGLENSDPREHDIDCDGLPDGLDDDVDGDGLLNAVDEDVDGDGVPNALDWDVDGDGWPNGEDDDIDGDGLVNGADGNVDGDEWPNGVDWDVDGDGVPNGSDLDVNGDGTSNADDEDIDGDGLANDVDADMDGDGLDNAHDDDDDGDGLGDDADDDDNGGCDDRPDFARGSGGCRVRVRALRLIDSGSLSSWATGQELAQPPPGGWHYSEAAGGAQHPAVLGLDHGFTDMMLRLRITGGPGVHAVRLRAWVGRRIVAERAYQLFAGAAPHEQDVRLVASAAWPDLVGIDCRIHPAIVFQYALDGGTWRQAGAATMPRLYVLKEADGSNGWTRYDLGAEKIVTYAGGESSVASIAQALTRGVADEICYDSTYAPGIDHPLDVYRHGRSLCVWHADLLAYLSSFAGSGGRTIFCWGGDSQYRAYYRGPDELWYSLRMALPACDLAPANPHYSFHAVTEIDGQLYDPSYGLTFLSQADEVCPPFSLTEQGIVHFPPDPNDPIQVAPSQQTGPHIPPTKQVEWRCPH